LNERFKGSEIRQNYSELYENAATEAERYKQLYDEREQENYLLKCELEQSKGEYEN
jgi:hypothetical protein